MLVATSTHPISRGLLLSVLFPVEKLLFTQTTIPVCEDAAEEASELITNTEQLNEETIQRLFVLLRGMR